MRRDHPQVMDSERQARRHLLKLAAYVPPAILGVMIAGPRMALAAQSGDTQHCDNGAVIVVSAAGHACCPCVPASQQYDPNTCNLNRCQLGNCTACSRVIFHNKASCQKATALCGCTCKPLSVEGSNQPFWMCS